MDMLTAEGRSWADGQMLSAVVDGIGVATFNRPEKHNAVSIDMWSAMADILADFAADNAVKVVVLRGAGTKAFVSGADISQFDKVRDSAAGEEDFKVRTAAGRRAIATCPKPTIAAIRGYCLGGGLGIAMQADLRLACAGSVFGIPAAKLGLAYGFVGLKDLVSLVGPANARMIMFTADRFGAEEAERIGLINRVFAEDEFSAQVLAIAGRIAANAPLSVAAAKAGIGQVVLDSTDRDMERLARLEKLCFDSDDYREGRKAFAEKRPPQFTGH